MQLHLSLSLTRYVHNSRKGCPRACCSESCHDLASTVALETACMLSLWEKGDIVELLKEGRAICILSSVLCSVLFPIPAPPFALSQAASVLLSSSSFMPVLPSSSPMLSFVIFSVKLLCCSMKLKMRQLERRGKNEKFVL